MTFPLRQKDSVAWLAPAPLWDLSLAAGGTAQPRFHAPAILRFMGDGFMDQIARTFAEMPEALSSYVVRPETWRTPGAGWQSSEGAGPVKLYHPVHNRFYLVTASLVCRRAGLPDRMLARNEAETAGFLLRRLMPAGEAAVEPAVPATYREAAWIGDAQAGTWVPLANPLVPAAGEERLGLFPLTFKAGGQPRRIHAGLIPVARGAIYAGAEQAKPVPAAERAGDPLGDPRVAALTEGVLGGLESLAGLRFPPASLPPADVQTDQHRQARAALCLAFLDIAEHLDRENPSFIAVLTGAAAGALPTPEQAIWDHLAARSISGGRTGLQILLLCWQNRAALADGRIDDALTLTILGVNPVSTVTGTFANGVLGSTALQALLTAALTDLRRAEIRDLTAAWTVQAEDWTPLTPKPQALSETALILMELDAFLARETPEAAAALPNGTSPIAADAPLLAAFQGEVEPGLTWAAALADARASAAVFLGGQIDGTRIGRIGLTPTALAPLLTVFLSLVQTQVGTAVAARALPAAAAPGTAGTAAAAPPLYVIRCVHERPACAGIHPPAMSQPSRVFRLASFFDTDAPVRPLKIEMPVETSIADFRKAPKGVAIQLSKELRKQISRVRDAALDQPLGDQVGGGAAFDLGVVCSLSIPIITICALILLLILVSILNIVFWWLPYFILCFPVRSR